MQERADSITLNRVRGQVGSRLRVAAVLVVVCTAISCAIYGSRETPSAQAGESSGNPVPFVPSDGKWVARGARYVLTVDQTGLATLQSSEGLPYTSFPLAATSLGASLAGATATVTEQAGVLSVTERLGGSVASLVEVRAVRSGVLVQASIGVAAQGAAGSQEVDFLSEGQGSRGLALGGELGGWTPQSGPTVSPQDEYMRLPFVSGFVAQINGQPAMAFGPPPLDVGLHFAAGWLGIGLVEIPDATEMRVTPDGGVSINYPVSTLAKIPDTGAGGSFSGLVRFPELELTVGSTPFAALASYSRLLARLDGSAGRSSHTPAWWRRPLVDTFGQQNLDGVTNWVNPSGYTAAYVQRFARRYRQRFGIRRATLVIDATWQKNPGPLRDIGDPEPGPLFGGYAGMRRLIDSLHRSGFKVLLWWQTWRALPGSYADQLGILQGGCRTNPCPPGSDPYGTIDPTNPNFPVYVRSVTQRLLGSGPGDLNADGLKMDYVYLEPYLTWHDPSLGTGLAASHLYFATFQQAARLVKPSAFLTAAIAAPQFADAVDAIRLDDAAFGADSSEAKWQARARVAAAAQPGTLIDSDGWATDGGAALEHFLTAAVYGVPELDDLSAWPNGPLDTAEARLIGQIQTLAATRPAGGSPVYAAPDHWLSLRAGRVVAETLRSTYGATLRSTYGGGHLAGVDVWMRKRIRVLATTGTRIAVPLHGAVARSVTAGSRRVRWHVEGSRLVLRLQRGEEATVVLAHRPPACYTTNRCARGW